ncbi:filamentous hemagglutinin [Cricetibacter osteomyelitidis]|uniref:Filamentous hemagglutinin n=1 Tax=Cricetibacter osteomyelitidis TaxID=1521931 RepID=A0A4R2SUB7_9PAST|nr:hemagglutinin repeat-containing protein [Cricetibacter osteomyelitidis]TCP92076.1 filamentous hemagglutinin [Cricetibacter osteomyelitidis]
MNKQCFRVIFSKTRQRLIVTSELAKSADKSTSPQSAVSSDTVFATLKPLAFSLFCALGFVTFSASALADTLIIKADPNAPKNQQPIVLQTANGLPQVNIQTPNEKGLSHNKYRDFNVDTKGAILNNSYNATKTQQAGLVQGNPYLARGEAKVILNEVTSTNPSRLKGYLEVAGKKAEVIIANPNGLHCDGCGTINATRSTLTTGKPQIKDGRVDGFNVEKGKVKISGKGLDNSRVDYTDILAREAEINAGVWAGKKLNVVTGANEIKQADIAQADSDLTITRIDAKKLAENTPHFALDVSELGGMYAGKIHLVGTEQGLGVRNAGHIGASAGELVINTQGRLVNSNHLSAGQSVKLVTAENLENTPTGKILAQRRDVIAQVGKKLEQQGIISAGNKIQLSATQLEQSAAAELQSGKIQVEVKDNIVNRGLINSQSEQGTSQTYLKAKEITNIGTGRLYGDHIALQGNKVENLDEQSDTTLKSAVIAARERLDIGTAHLLNQSHYYSGNAENGSQILSQGAFSIGGILNEQYQATGKAHLIENRSGLIQAQSARWHADKIVNQNDFFATEQQIVSDTPINWHYLVPQGQLESDARFDMSYMFYRTWTRGHNAMHPRNYPDAQTLTKPQNGDVLSHILPEVNQCQSGAGTNCEIRPASYYFPDDPAWKAFGIDTQQRASAGTRLMNVTVPVAPVEPQKPTQPTSTNPAAQQQYKKQLAEYETKKMQYEQDYAKYLQDNAHFEAEVKPLYAQWVSDNEAQFAQLAAKIQQHNQSRYNRRNQEYRDYWLTKLNRQVIKEDVVTKSQAGKILIEQNADINSAAFINDKSQLLAGGTLNITGELTNLNASGTRFTENHGQKYYSQEVVTGKTASGRNKYGRDTTLITSGVVSNTPTTITLPVATVFQQYDFNANDPLTENKNTQTATLPSSSLYKLNPNADSHVLIETDPAFTKRKNWLSSNYMYKALRAEHDNVHKRLGDGYYEQRLVREQINRLTGRNFFGDNTDYEEQYKALMDAGLTFAEKFNLRVGIALTPAQVAQLTSDIVWLETQSVILPSGEKVDVLVPKVYAVVKKGDIDGSGTLLSAKSVKINSNEMLNQGTIAGREFVAFNAEKLTNRGKISGDVVKGNVSGNLDNLGGTLEADNALLLNIGGDFNHVSTTATSHIDSAGFKRTETNLDRKALLHVKDENGVLHVNANNINLNGADIINDGQGGSYLAADNHLNLGTVEVGFNKKMGGGNHYRNESLQDVAISSVKSVGDLLLRATNIYSEGAQLESDKKLTALAENNLVLGTAARTDDYEEYHKTKSRSALSRKSKETFDAISRTQQLGTTVVGSNVTLAAGNDVTAHALSAVATEGDLVVQAKNNVTLNAGTNHSRDVHWEKKKKSGVFSGGGIGITFGSKSEKHRNEAESWTQSDARSVIGSEAGHVIVQAGNHVQLTGTDTIAQSDKTIRVQGASVKVEAGRDIIETSEKHVYKQSGLTIALSTPVTDALQNTYNAVQNAKRTEKSNHVLSGLYAIKAAQEAAIAAQNVSKVADTLDNMSNGLDGLQRNDAAAQSPAVKIAVSYGDSKQESETKTRTVTHDKATFQAGNLEVVATDEKVILQGVDTNITDKTRLDGKAGIDVLGVKDTYDSHTKDSSHSASVGVFVGFNGNSYGIGVEGSAQIGKGKENTSNETWQNSQLNTGTLITHSGGTLTLDAANANVNRWEVNVKGLDITSRQDTEKYESKQTSAGGSFSVTYGSGGGGSVNASYSKAKMDYAQVNQQSGIRVGSGGMDVNVEGHTQLNGAIIESEATTDKNQFSTKTFGSADMHNYSKLKTESVSINAGTSGFNPTSAAMSLLGNRRESDSSTTKSAVSANINLNVKNGGIPTALLRDTKNTNEKVGKQNLQKIREQQEMAKVIGEISDNAIKIAAHKELEAIEQANLELGKIKQRAKDENWSEEKIKNDPTMQRAQDKVNNAQKAYDDSYGIGSTKGQTIKAVTAALQGLANKSPEQAVVALASPYLNKKIHEATQNADGTINKPANLAAHAVLSAIEAQVTGNNALAGAVAGVTAEGTAMLIAEKFYDKPIDKLTSNEKQNVVFLSQLASGLAAGIVGNSTADTVAGAETGKRAVENNNLRQYMQMSSAETESLIKYSIFDNQLKEIEKEVTQTIQNNISDKPHYLSGNLNWYKHNIKFAFNTETNDLFVGYQGNIISDVSPFNFGGSIETGWILTLTKDERKNLGRSINNVLAGSGANAGGCLTFLCGSIGTTLPTDKNRTTHQTIGIGIGSGYYMGVDSLHKVTRGE